jgi:hypothetical protein
MSRLIIVNMTLVHLIGSLLGPVRQVNGEYRV